MKVVSGSGALQTSGFDWGCSHSGYERVVWDPAAKKFVAVCKNDAAAGGKSGRLAFAPGATTIYPVDLAYSNLGNVLMAGGRRLLDHLQRHPGRTARRRERPR